MDNQEKIEKLIATLMTSDRLETPSIDFTQKVVDKVVANKNQKIEYKPLLPMWLLALTAILIIGFLAYGINLYVVSETSTIYFKDLNKIGLWTSNFFEQLNFSNTMTYTIVISGFLVCLHTLILKKYFENRLA